MRRFIPLQVKLTGLVAMLLTVMAAASLGMLGAWMRHVSEQGAAERAIAVARVLANALRPALEAGDAADARRLLNLTTGTDVEYEEVRRADGSLLTIVIPAANAADPRRSRRASIPVELTIPGGRDYAFKTLEGRVCVLARIEVPSEDAAGARALGTLRMDFSLGELEAETAEHLRIALAVAILVVLLGSLLGYLLGNVLVAPIKRLTVITAAMAERGDLRQRVDIHTNDETGLLAARFQHMVDSQRSLLGALQQSVAGVAEVIDAISRAGGTVGKGANTIEGQVQATAAAMRNMQQVIEGVGANVEELRQSSDRSTAAITQMVTANEAVADNVGVMAENVEQSATAIDQMAGHVQRVASSITELDRAVVSTGESMTEIQRSIDAVQDSARITAQLSARALADAEAGGTALQDTITSMERIRATTTQAFSVLAALGQSMRDIGGIVELINDLAHKTNLLALNAGIIASHAGEHGAAFNVVAAEIKTLADRTRSSTAEITAVIGRIQGESQGASAAMQAGMLSVDDGARVGADAASKLTHIQASARESSLRVAAIARATQDEATQTRSVAEAFERIGRNLQRLSTTAQEQARDSQRMRNTTKDINVLTQAVKRSSQEQAVGSRQVIEAMGEIHHVVKQVQDAQGQQSSAAQSALLAVEEIRRVSAQQNESVQRLENVIDVLRRQTLELQGVMGRFKT